MTLPEYIVFALSSLFVIVDPIATVPAFLAMTPADTPEQRIRMARLACLVMAGVLLAFALMGRAIFHFLGITIPSFQMAGSVILLLIALDMLRAQRSRVQETPEETFAGAEKEDIAVTPLAVPMLAGPGAISTVILLHGRAAEDWSKQISLLGCIVAVALVTYLILALSARGAKWLSPIALRLTTRVMGLLLAAIAMQFFINALKELGLIKS
ncbi:MAG TPA: MarC family protein [Candidatus Angelobacter sp.]|nr:MarC family protein [Candidatus Angelobacter sp.]